MTFIWDTNYEATPGNLVPRDQIRWEIQKAKIGIQDRMSVEHQWGTLFVEADQGKHWPGHVAVADKGNNAGAITNPQEGSIYLYDGGAGLYKLMCYHSAAWIVMCTLDHGSLSNLLTDSHTQYLKLNGGTIPTGDLVMGTHLLMPGTGVAGTKEYGQFLTMGHKAESHPTLGDAAVIKSGVISATKLKITSADVASGTIAPGDSISVGLHSYGFVPQVLIEAGSSTSLVWMGFGQHGLYLHHSGNFWDPTYNYRVRQRYISA